MKLSQVVSLYISHKRALGYRFNNEEAILRSFYKEVGDRSIRSIKAAAVLIFLNGNGPVTVYWAKKHRVLSGLFRFALTRGLTNISPLPSIIPKPDVPAFVPYISMRNSNACSTLSRPPVQDVFP